MFEAVHLGEMRAQSDLLMEAGAADIAVLRVVTLVVLAYVPAQRRLGHVDFVTGVADVRSVLQPVGFLSQVATGVVRLGGMFT